MTEALSEQTVTYELDHMATFSLSTKQGLVKPMDALERLREMESTIGVWTMKVTLRINGQKVVVLDRATNKDIERFPVSRLTNATSVSDAEGLYGNVVIFTVQSEAAQSCDIHLFQAATKQQSDDLVDDVNAAISGRFPRQLLPTPTRSKPGDQESRHSHSPQSSNSRSSHDDMPRPAASSAVVDQSLYQPRPPPNDVKPAASKDDINNEVLLLNHCFDDIERFVASLQQAANAQKELDRRRVVKGGHDPAEDMLRRRAKLPPTKDFIDVLQKFKLAFNLLPRLRSVLKDPDAVQLLHMLFSPLSVVVEACRDDQGHSVVASKVGAPLLTDDACHLLDTCLHPRETELWESLGHAWTTPSSRWSGVVPTFSPQFSDGWRYPDVNMVDIGLSLPSVTSTTNTYQQSTNSTAVTTSERSKAIEPSSGQYAQVRSRPANDASQNVAQHQQQLSASPESAHPSVQPSVSSSQPVQAAVNLDASQQRFLQQLHTRGARVYVAIATRDGKNQKELSVKAGDVVEVIDSSKNWWKVQNHTEATGFLPNTILKPFSAE